MTAEAPLDPSDSRRVGGDGPLCVSGILKKRECPLVLVIASGWRNAHASLTARTDDDSGGYDRSSPCAKHGSLQIRKKLYRSLNPMSMIYQTL